MDHVRQHESSASASALNRLHQHLATLVKCFLNETVGSSEVAFGIFTLLVLNVEREILEVFVPQGVGLAGDVQNVCDTGVNQVLSLESGLERSHKNAIVNFKQRNLFQSD